MKTDSTVTKGKAKAKKIADVKNLTSKGNAIKTALQSITAEIETAVITAYKKVNETAFSEYYPKYLEFQKNIIINKPRNVNFFELLNLPFDEFKLQINALDNKHLRAFATACLLCLKFVIKFDACTSLSLQALFNEITKISISKISKFSESMFHFGLHANCKFQTNETGLNKESKLFDKVAMQVFNVYPLAMKEHKQFTKIEKGHYYPIPELSILYCIVANAFTQEKLEYLMHRFYDKQITEKEKLQIKA